MSQRDPDEMTKESAKPFERLVIGGKNVYVVDDHQKALAAWAEERRNVEHPANLITIDHHTDVMEAFLSHAACAAYDDPDADEEALRRALLAEIDWKSEKRISAAIELLKHDEHIHAATMSGILGSAFTIQLSDSDGTSSLEWLAYKAQRSADFGQGRPIASPPRETMTYEPRPDRIYVIPFKCAIGCEKQPYDDECLIHHAWEIIETRYLDDQLARGAEIARCLGIADMEAAPYILDIDLDVFHSSRAVQPEDPSTFYRLVRNAVAITIAMEDECVAHLWHDQDRVLTAKDLLAIVLGHIEAAFDAEASSRHR
jgi:hypothetical protein